MRKIVLVVMTSAALLLAGCTAGAQQPELPPCVGFSLRDLPSHTAVNRYTGQKVVLRAVDLTITRFGVPTDVAFNGFHMGFPSEIKVDDGTFRPIEVGDTLMVLLPQGENVLTGPWEPGTCINTINTMTT